MFLPEDSWIKTGEGDEFEVEEILDCTALLFEFDARRAWESRREAAQTTGEEELEEWKESEEESGWVVERQ